MLVQQMLVGQTSSRTKVVSSSSSSTQKSYSLEMTKFHVNNWIGNDNGSVEELAKTAVAFSLAYEGK
jgi:hypothetical protein